MTAVETSLTTKESLLRAGKKVFAEKGFDGATVKDIADTAGVNISLVSYHFHGKENLFRECVKAYGENRLRAAERFFHPIQSSEEFRVRLTLYLEDYFTNATEDPDTMLIMAKECMSMNDLTRDIFEDTFLKGAEMMTTFFKDAKAKKILRSDLDPHYLVLTIMGAMIHAVKIDPIHEILKKTGLKDKGHRDKLVSTLVTLVMGGTSI